MLRRLYTSCVTYKPVCDTDPDITWHIPAVIGAEGANPTQMVFALCDDEDMQGLLRSAAQLAQESLR